MVYLGTLNLNIWTMSRCIVGLRISPLVLFLYISIFLSFQSKFVSLTRIFQSKFVSLTRIFKLGVSRRRLGYSRQNQTKITRCRIGHTRLTHAYLLTNDQPPFCISCNEPFIVKHFLITCTEFNHIRKNYYTTKTVKELFSDTPSDKIINFVKEINLF